VSPDPRLAVIDRRLADVRRIVAVTGGKGGIGKSLVASTLALTCSRAGRRVGLLDCDLTGPCDHLILGIESGVPEEKFGVEPQDVHGLRFMSVTCFGGDDAFPLRGADVTDALIELLAITRWGGLDLLVIDMPPGLGDASLDTIRLIDRAEFLVVTTASRIVLATVRRTLRLLERTGRSVVGVVENMSRGPSEEAEILARDSDVEFLGRLPYDDAIETALGSVEKLAGTDFARALSQQIRGS
jgi:ATP-binding protein involved in chromosome partitioning